MLDMLINELHARGTTETEKADLRQRIALHTALDECAWLQSKRATMFRTQQAPRLPAMGSTLVPPPGKIFLEVGGGGLCFYLSIVHQLLLRGYTGNGYTWRSIKNNALAWLRAITDNLTRCLYMATAFPNKHFFGTVVSDVDWAAMIDKYAPDDEDAEDVVIYAVFNSLNPRFNLRIYRRGSAPYEFVCPEANEWLEIVQLDLPRRIGEAIQGFHFQSVVPEPAADSRGTRGRSSRLSHTHTRSHTVPAPSVARRTANVAVDGIYP